MRKLVSILWLFMVTGVYVLASSPEETGKIRFDFGSGPQQEGFTRVTSETVYNAARGYGFDFQTRAVAVNRKGKDQMRGDFCTSDKPFLFSVKLPDGNYRITVTLGDRKGSSSTVIKAEARRLMVEKAETKRGEFTTVSFIVNVRSSQIPGGAPVLLNMREMDHPNWDDKLTLEFNGERPCVCAVEIEPAPNAVTIFLAGDSTVTDQKEEPWAAWGQMLPLFFSDGAVVANHAESGETLSNFMAQRRLEKILSLMKPGDYLFIQFAHNDMKQQPPQFGPFTSYKRYLKQYIDLARAKGGIPVLVTSMHRRRFDEQGKVVNTLMEYPEAMRQSAAEEKTPLIDLLEMSARFYEALGPEGSKKAFVHYPAGTFPGQTSELKDDTHFNPYGAYELAKCIVEGIRAEVPALAAFLKPGVPAYNPSKPSDSKRWAVPPSPNTSLLKPAGN